MDAGQGHFNPLETGLGYRFTQGDTIISGLWNRARAEQGIVGSCRLCGGHLTPLPTEERIGTLEWFEARCLLCQHEIASPGGRVLRRSSRHSEQPVEWRETRMARLLAGQE